MNINPKMITDDVFTILKKPGLVLNIISTISFSELTFQINEICNQAEHSDHAVIVLRFTEESKPSHFHNWPGEVKIQAVSRWEKAVRRLERCIAPVIALASGPTYGSAMDLFLAADYRITAPDFCLHIPMNEEHVWPSMAIYRLVNQIGLARSRQLLLGNKEITSEYALSIGLIDEISDDIESVLCATVSRFSKMATTEFSIRRNLMLEASAITFEDALGTYLAACDREIRRLYKNKS